ncbi:MAG: VWA domain-containing protein [Chloroflexi bacterium]|nr:VWA domain-containing protein [Chloroflexota bacterium]MDL1882743.1 VWA domain-containing protein [Anaerolineae bacterium CFX8]
MAELLDALADCLDRVQSGERLENCLRDYPEHAGRLRDLLKTADLVFRAQQDADAETADEQSQVRGRLEQALQKRRLHQQTQRRVWVRRLGLLAAACVALVSVSLVFLAMLGPSVGSVFSNIVNAYSGVASYSTPVPGRDSPPREPVTTSVALMTPAPPVDGLSGVTALPVGPTAGFLEPQAAPTQMALMPLSAGEINDNARWDDYLLYRRNFLAQYAGVVHDVDVSGRQIIVVADEEGLPVLGARVQVYAGQRLVSDSRTYATGQTLFFPSARPEAQNAQSFRVVVSKGEIARQFTLDPQRGPVWTITLAQAERAAARLDVLFLLDATGSMGDEIAQLQNNILNISSQIADRLRNADVRYGLVTYRDRGDAYVTQTTDFTPEVSQFQASLNTVRADGGGDNPESLNEALHKAVHNVSWRGDDTVKLIFLVADAPPHLDYPNDYDYAQEMVAAAQRGIKIHPIASSGLTSDGEFIFRQIAQYTMGHFIFLTYEQGVPGTPGESRPDLHVGEAADPQTGQQGDYTVERLADLVLRLIMDEMAALNRKAEIAAGAVSPALRPAEPPPTPTPVLPPAQESGLQLPDLGVLWRSELSLPIALAVVGLGVYLGYAVRRPAPKRKRKNDEIIED